MGNLPFATHFGYSEKLENFAAYGNARLCLWGPGCFSRATLTTRFVTPLVLKVPYMAP